MPRVDQKLRAVRFALFAIQEEALALYFSHLRRVFLFDKSFYKGVRRHDPCETLCFLSFFLVREELLLYSGSQAATCLRQMRMICTRQHRILTSSEAYLRFWELIRAIISIFKPRKSIRAVFDSSCFGLHEPCCISIWVEALRSKARVIVRWGLLVL